MHYKVNIQPDAKTDIIESSNRYDEQHFGLGEEFIQRVDKALIQILLQPLGYQKIFMNFRKLLIKQFPYCIYYLVDYQEKKIDIIAVIHPSRNPDIWKKRTDKK